jgi:hypothetical protein
MVMIVLQEKDRDRATTRAIERRDLLARRQP